MSLYMEMNAKLLGVYHSLTSDFVVVLRSWCQIEGMTEGFCVPRAADAGGHRRQLRGQ